MVQYFTKKTHIILFVFIAIFVSFFMHSPVDAYEPKATCGAVEEGKKHGIFGFGSDTVGDDADPVGVGLEFCLLNVSEELNSVTFGEMYDNMQAGPYSGTTQLTWMDNAIANTLGGVQKQVRNCEGVWGFVETPTDERTVTIDLVRSQGQCPDGKDMRVRYRLVWTDDSFPPKTDEHFFYFFKTIGDSIFDSKEEKTGQCLCRKSINGGTASEERVVISSLLSSSECAAQQIDVGEELWTLDECTWVLTEEAEEKEIPKEKKTVADTTESINDLKPLLKKINPLQTTSLQVLFGRLVQIGLGVLGTIALVIFIYGGFLWMTAMGSGEQTKQAFSTLLWGALGVIVILASYAILDFVLRAFL